MPRYRVYIGEPVSTIEAADTGSPTPVPRNVSCATTAEDEQAAKAAGWRAWDEKYGPRAQPVQAIVKVVLLAD